MWAASVFVGGGHDLDRDGAAGDAVADVDLVNPVEPRLAQQQAGATRSQYFDGGSESLERGEMEVVEVHVREQDEVGFVQVG